MQNFIEIEASNPGFLARERRNSVIDGNSDIEAPTKTLDELIAEITIAVSRGDESIVATAKLMGELKRRVEDGQAGIGVKWLEWAPRTFGRGKTWLYDMNMIANAKDPEAAVARLHKKNGDRQRRYIDRLAARNSEWTDVIKTIRSMDPKHAPTMRRYLRTFR